MTANLHEGKPIGRADSATRGPQAAVFFAFFAFYLLTSSRERAWGDANPVYEVAQNLVTTGSVAVSVRWPADAEPGRAGKYYAFQPILGSLVHVPGALLHAVVVKLRPDSPDADALSTPWAVHLGPAAMGAFVCVLFFGLCRRHGMSLEIASLGTVVVGLGTGIWVYARSPFTEIVQTACFSAFVVALIDALHDPTPRRARWLGLWAGLLINTKVVFAVALPGPALLLAWTFRRDPRLLGRMLLWAAAAMLPGVALALYYNWLRFGSVLNAGYNTHYGSALFGRGRLWVGLWGFLFSPGKSLFLYSPPLLLALLGLPRLYREHRATFLAFLAVGLPVVLLYGKLAVWHGDWAWGPRYLTFLLPMAAFPACLVLQQLARERRRLALAGLAAGTLALGGFVQVLGNAFYWDHYIRLVVFQASRQWLGQPNVKGAIAPDRGGFCDGCFETMYPIEYLPPFQPIVGHWWLLKHVPFGHTWAQAERDAPWHPHTTLPLQISDYDRARVDWWILAHAEARAVAAAIVTVLMVVLALALWRWWRHVTRSGRASPRAPDAAAPLPPAAINLPPRLGED
jgi:hypothetical protein